MNTHLYLKSEKSRQKRTKLAAYMADDSLLKGLHIWPWHFSCFTMLNTGSQTKWNAESIKTASYNKNSLAYIILSIYYIFYGITNLKIKGKLHGCQFRTMNTRPDQSSILKQTVGLNSLYPMAFFNLPWAIFIISSALSCYCTCGSFCFLL